MGTKNKPGVFDCYIDAEDDQPMFVLLAGDPDAPNTVEEWARRRFDRLAASVPQFNLTKTEREESDKRIMRGLRKIAEALQCAQAMRDWKPKPPPLEMIIPLAPREPMPWLLDNYELNKEHFRQDLRGMGE